MGICVVLCSAGQIPSPSKWYLVAKVLLVLGHLEIAQVCVYEQGAESWPSYACPHRWARTRGPVAWNHCQRHGLFKASIPQFSGREVKAQKAPGVPGHWETKKPVKVRTRLPWKGETDWGDVPGADTEAWVNCQGDSAENPAAAGWELYHHCRWIQKSSESAVLQRKRRRQRLGICE